MTIIEEYAWLITFFWSDLLCKIIVCNLKICNFSYYFILRDLICILNKEKIVVQTTGKQMFSFFVET